MEINGTCVYDVRDNQTIYLCQKSDLDVKNINNWKFNRPADEVRLNCIRKHYDESKIDLIDHIIYAWDDGNGTLQIYDGWNRFLSARASMKLLLCVWQTKDASEIQNHFKALNSAVPVPEMYQEDTDVHKKSLIDAAIKHLEFNFASLKKPTKKPRAPHYNRDNMIQMLSDLDIQWSDITAEDFIETLKKVNMICKTVQKRQ